MKQFWGLLHNEWSKMTRRASFVVLGILMVLLFAVPPLMQYASQSLMGAMYTTREDSPYIDPEHLRQKYKREISELRGASGEREALLLRFNQDQLKAIDTLMQYHIGRGDWREAKVQSYLELQTVVTALELIGQGYASAAVEEAFPDLEVLDEPQEYALQLQSAKERMLRLEEEIKANDYLPVLQQRLADQQGMLASLKEQAAGVQGETQGNQLLRDRKNNSVIYAEKLIQATELLIAQGANPSAQQWKFATYEALQQVCESRAQRVLLTKEQFEAQRRQRDESTQDYAYQDYIYYENYDSYHKETTLLINQEQEQIELYLYSLEHQLPTVQITGDRARSIGLHGTLGTVSTIGIFLIVFAATSVASEHASGTIRLLLIRPVKRWKILTAKLSAIVLAGIAAIVASYAVNLIVSGLIGGFSDYLYPVLVRWNGGLAEVNSLLYILYSFLCSILPQFLLMSLAFMLSVVTKKTVLALIIPFLLPMFSGIIFLLTQPLGILDYLVISYMDLSGFFLFSGTVQVYNGLSMIQLDLGIGCLLLFVHIAVAVALSYLVFSRQQIKS